MMRVTAFLPVFCACQRPPMPPPGPILPFVDAVAVVNENISRIGGTLRAVGSVDGKAQLEDGRRVSFALDGVLFFLQPRSVRFDLKRFGDRKLLIGSNQVHYWYFDSEHDLRWCARHDQPPDSIEHPVPIPPDQIVAALGLSAIPAGRNDDHARIFQRVEGDYQQILFLDLANGPSTLRKEYWLDRRSPRLVRRVIFRDPDGRVEMESTLDDYRPLSESGPLLPFDMAARWPANGASLRFRVSRWTLHTDIGPEGIQFRSPSDCEAP